MPEPRKRTRLSSVAMEVEYQYTMRLHHKHHVYVAGHPTSTQRNAEAVEAVCQWRVSAVSHEQAQHGTAPLLS